MRLTELILVMLMFANTLDDVIADKEVKIQKEKFENSNVQRKLDETTNYVTKIFNQDSNFTLENKNFISNITINNIEQNLDEEIAVPKDTEIQVHYQTIISRGNVFLRDIKDSSTIKRNIVSIDFSKFDSSNLKTTDNMLMGFSSLKSINFLNFDTSKVTRMNGMFYGCSSLTSIDLSNFDTSKVTNMTSMFDSCKSLKSIDLSKFDTSNVTNMNIMFEFCSSLTSIDLSNFNTSKVT